MAQIENDMTKLLFQQGMKRNIEQKRMKFSSDFTDEKDISGFNSSRQQDRINRSLSSNNDLNLFLFGGKRNPTADNSIRQEIESTFLYGNKKSSNNNTTSIPIRSNDTSAFESADNSGFQSQIYSRCDSPRSDRARSNT